MTTLKLKVNDKILDKVLWLLSQFKKEDLQIINSKNSFEKDQTYVQKALQSLESDESKSYTVEEVDELLEKSIRRSEG